MPGASVRSTDFPICSNAQCPSSSVTSTYSAGEELLKLANEVEEVGRLSREGYITPKEAKQVGTIVKIDTTFLFNF